MHTVSERLRKVNVHIRKLRPDEMPHYVSMNFFADVFLYSVLIVHDIDILLYHIVFNAKLGVSIFQLYSFCRLVTDCYRKRNSVG